MTRWMNRMIRKRLTTMSMAMMTRMIRWYQRQRQCLKESWNCIFQQVWIKQDFCKEQRGKNEWVAIKIKVHYTNNALLKTSKMIIYNLRCIPYSQGPIANVVDERKEIKIIIENETRQRETKCAYALRSGTSKETGSTARIRKKTKRRK